MKRYIFYFTFALLAATFAISCSNSNDGDETTVPASSVIKKGTGNFTYTDYEPLKNKPVKVYYSVPDTDLTNLPIVLVFPGTNRDAVNYIQPWESLSSKYKCMVFAIEFPEAYYTDNEYITGNVITSSGSFVDKKNWTFSIVEPLFEYIKSQTGNTTANYLMFGHSAGSQFVHRFVLFNGASAKIKTAISANAGWYTEPATTIAFPYGLKNTQLSEADIKAAMNVKMIIHLGQNDTDPNDSSIRHTPEADAQGLYRYARGLYFYNKSKAHAESNDYFFNWTKREVPNVGHDQAAMAADAAKAFFE